MPEYNPNHPESIRTVFDNDGSSLRKQGFKFPGDLRVLADDARPRVDSHSTSQSIGDGMPESHVEAYGRYLATGNEEIAFE